MHNVSLISVYSGVAGIFWLAASIGIQQFLKFSDGVFGILTGIGIGLSVLALLTTRRGRKRPM